MIIAVVLDRSARLYPVYVVWRISKGRSKVAALQAMGRKNVLKQDQRERRALSMITIASRDQDLYNGTQFSLILFCTVHILTRQESMGHELGSNFLSVPNYFWVGACRLVDGAAHAVLDCQAPSSVKGLARNQSITVLRAGGPRSVKGPKQLYSTRVAERNTRYIYCT